MEEVAGMLLRGIVGFALVYALLVWIKYGYRRYAMPSKVVLKPLKGSFKNISLAEATQMEKEGRAYKPSPMLAPGIYFEKVPDEISALQELEEKEDPLPKLARDQTYQTRTMEAAKPAVPRRRTYRKTGTPKE